MSTAKAHKYKENQDYYRLHYGSLVREYPDLFVAVSDGAVVLSDTDQETLLIAIQEKGLAQEAYIGYLNSRKAPPLPEEE